MEFCLTFGQYFAPRASRFSVVVHGFQALVQDRLRFGIDWLIRADWKFHTSMLPYQPPASKGLPDRPQSSSIRPIANQLMRQQMSGQRPDLKITVRDGEGALKELFAAWTQEKGHLAGKIHVTDEIAALFQPGAEIPAFVFKNGDHPEPKPAEPKSRKRAAEKPQPRPAA